MLHNVFFSPLFLLAQIIPVIVTLMFAIRGLCVCVCMCVPVSLCVRERGVTLSNPQCKKKKRRMKRKKEKHFSSVLFYISSLSSSSLSSQCPLPPDLPSWFSASPSGSMTSSSSPRVSRASIDILEELQLIAAQNMEKLEINRYYEVIRELGKGTYGKVDLVVHKIRGECNSPQKQQNVSLYFSLCTEY